MLYTVYVLGIFYRLLQNLQQNTKIVSHKSNVDGAHNKIKMKENQQIWEGKKGESVTQKKYMYFSAYFYAIYLYISKML